MVYSEDERRVCLLAPLAVETTQQRKGVGLILVRDSLDRLREKGVDAVLTYGDPAYYTRAGFATISIADAAAPQELTMPHGWMAQSLTGREFVPLRGRCSCAGPLNRPELW